MGSGNPKPVGGIRGKCVGWSPSSHRRHMRWLYGVRSDELTGEGVALTLTVRDVPPSHDDWHHLLRMFFKALRRRGFVRVHWVVEWQRRGAPHVHMALYANSVKVEEVIGDWLRLAGKYGALRSGQDAKPIEADLGWLRYLAKHSARTVAHYQRSGLPPGWHESGRVWGHLGEWPTEEPIRAEVTPETFYRARRWVRNLRRSQALSEGNTRAADAIGRSLRCSERSLSSVRGVSSFVPQERFLEMLGVAGWSGEMRG